MEFRDHPTGNAFAAAAAQGAAQADCGPELTQSSVDPRAARIAELRKEYLQGTYQVDAAQLASDIVAKHLKK